MEDFRIARVIRQINKNVKVIRREERRIFGEIFASDLFNYIPHTNQLQLRILYYII